MQQHIDLSCNIGHVHFDSRVRSYANRNTFLYISIHGYSIICSYRYIHICIYPSLFPSIYISICRDISIERESQEARVSRDLLLCVLCIAVHVSVCFIRIVGTMHCYILVPVWIPCMLYCP